MLGALRQVALLGNNDVPVRHDQHRVARGLDDKARTARFADVGNLHLDEDRRILELIQRLLVDRLPPAQGASARTAIRQTIVPRMTGLRRCRNDPGKHEMEIVRNIITVIGKCKRRIQLPLASRFTAEELEPRRSPRFDSSPPLSNGRRLAQLPATHSDRHRSGCAWVVLGDTKEDWQVTVRSTHGHATSCAGFGCGPKTLMSGSGTMMSQVRAATAEDASGVLGVPATSDFDGPISYTCRFNSAEFPCSSATRCLINSGGIRAGLATENTSFRAHPPDGRPIYRHNLIDQSIPIRYPFPRSASRLPRACPGSTASSWISASDRV